MLGCYYLHTNGDLIWKPAGVFYNTTPSEYFDSPFVVKWWAIPEKSPSGTEAGDVEFLMDLFLDAYKASPNKEKTKQRIYEISDRQKWSRDIPDAIIDEGSK